MKMKLAALLFLVGTVSAQAQHLQDKSAQLGDYGFNHHLLHDDKKTGVADILNQLKQKATGSSCCDAHGECRETIVNLAETKVFLNRRWCDIPSGVFKSWSIRIPDTVANIVVCASKDAADGNKEGCPYIWCIALRPSGS
jgi:hypothetical protein